MGLPVLVRGAQLANRLRTANNIVRFGRQAKAVQGLSASARSAELLALTKTLALPSVPSLTGPLFRTAFTATSFLVGLWAALNKPKVKPDAPAYDITKEGEWLMTPPSPGEHSWVIRATHKSSRPSLRNCSTGSEFSPPAESATPVPVTSLNVAGQVGLKIGKGFTKYLCGDGQSQNEIVPGLTLQEENGQKYDAISFNQIVLPNQPFYFAGDGVSDWVEIDNIELDNEPFPNPVPTPKPIRDPRPDPVPMPEAEPAMVPEKPKVVPIVKPAPKEVPDAEPTTEPAPAPNTTPKKTPVKVPTRTPVKTPTKTPTLPATTTITTIAGSLALASKAIVKTTPKDAHKFGNAGGRVAGRTASINPTQIAQELGRVEQKLAQIAKKPNTIGDLADILRLLGLLYDWTISQKGGTTYELQAFCECPEDADDCEEPVTKIKTSGGDYRSETLARIDAVAALLQPLKNYKQPICNEKPKLAGDFRTISFISDERTTAGDRYLSKRFRYRSQSGADLDTLVDHWKDFEWDAGPVCVQHSGHSWGTPQVWAASVDEGKRVIQHAGREAGVDPNQVGKWTVSGSNNPRFGLSGRMRVNTKGGYYWITERLGSNGRPLVIEL